MFMNRNFNHPTAIQNRGNTYTSPTISGRYINQSILKTMSSSLSKSAKKQPYRLKNKDVSLFLPKYARGIEREWKNFVATENAMLKRSSQIIWHESLKKQWIVFPDKLIPTE